MGMAERMTFVIRYTRREGHIKFRFASDPWLDDFHHLDQDSSFYAAEEYYRSRFGPDSTLVFQEDK